MPDQADVEQALAAFIAGVLYPNGEDAVSAVGTVCRVYRGFPVVGALEADLAAGIAQVTVQPVGGSLKDTSRFSTEWIGAAPVCPLVAQTEGVSVQFSGTSGSGMVAGVLVDGLAYVIRVTDPSTPGVVAAILSDMVRANRPATLSDATIIFPEAYQVLARAVSDGQGGEEIRRQEMLFRVSLWCPSPDVRDQLTAFIDLALAGIVFLDVGGWGCRIKLVNGNTDDEGAAVHAWRRDLKYLIEYPTVLTSSLPSLLFGSGAVNGAGYFG
jgi:hypothetical protein